MFICTISLIEIAGFRDFVSSGFWKTGIPGIALIFKYGNFDILRKKRNSVIEIMVLVSDYNQ